MQFTLIFECSDVCGETLFHEEVVEAASELEAFRKGMHMKNKAPSWFPEEEGVTVENITVQ